MNLLSHLLPDRTCVRLETWNVDPAHSAITLTLRAHRITACCPLCGRRSKRVHSRYERTLGDLPWGTYAVTVRLRVRRLFCRNTRCERRIFTERLPGIALPWARRTRRLDARLTALGLALGEKITSLHQERLTEPNADRQQARDSPYRRPQQSEDWKDAHGDPAIERND